MKNFIIISILILSHPAYADLFLFHNLHQQNEFKLLNDKSQFNILYINTTKCKSCFRHLESLKNINKNFLILTPHYPLRDVLRLMDKNKLSNTLAKNIYNDPGKRFVKAFKIQKYKSAILRVEKGKIIQIKRVNLAQKLSGYDIRGVWK